MNAKTKAELFRSLHVPGDPLVLFNIWDPGSARAVAASGAKALATGSWSVANANGYEDGEDLPFELAIENLVRVTRAVELPISIDLESGYGEDAAAVAETLVRSAEAGAVGCNLEDSFPTTHKLRPVHEQAARIEQSRRALEAVNPNYFINARTDVYLVDDPRPQTERVDDALARARAYAAAGASGFFVPGISDEEAITRITEESPLPVNVMMIDGLPGLTRLAQLKVARVSHGPGPYRGAMKWLEEAARKAMRRE